MNGRVYDPKLGVFLSADIVYQFTDDAHLLNRYAYVGNNPLSKIDPSGYFLNSIGGWVKDNWKGLVTTAVSVSVLIAASAIPPLAPIAPALSGAAGGLTGSLLNGQSLSTTLKNTYKGFIIGGVSGAATTVVGDLAEGQGLLGHLTTKVAGHSIVQGSVSVAYGGSFWSGAAAGAFTGGVFPFTNSLFSNSRTGRLIMAMTVGGTASELAGGEFANGALAAAFVQLYNDEKHRQQRQTNPLKLWLEYVRYESDATTFILGVTEDAAEPLFQITSKVIDKFNLLIDLGFIAYDAYNGDYQSMGINAFNLSVGIAVGGVLTVVNAPILVGFAVGIGTTVVLDLSWEAIKPK